MSCCGTIAPDMTAIGPQLDRERLLAASHRLETGLTQSDFLVPGMHCVACIHRIEEGLRDVAGVSDVRANLSTRRVSVHWRASGDDVPDFVGVLEKLGFQASLFDLADVHDEQERMGRRLLLSLAVAGFAAANIMLLSVSVWSGADLETTQLFHLISGVIAVPTVLYSGQIFFGSAVRALRGRQLNMDVPISLAVILALGMSIYESMAGGHEAYFDASVTLLFFLLIGRYLDHMMRERARGAVMQLSKMMPRGATRVLADGSLGYFPLNEIELGDDILVVAGERVPLDGRVVSGQSDLDRSFVTGEAEPVVAVAGMDVEAGVLNLTGPLQVKVMRSEDASFVAEVLQMMEAAEQSKSRYVRLADRAARIYAPAVHLLAAFAFVIWMFVTSGDWQTSLYVAIAVLIITCPCALGLAVPIAHVVAANRLFCSGILVKDGAGLEKLQDVDRVVLDKTGTLTLGKPKVVSVIGRSKNDQTIAASLAEHSSHPFAKAIADKFEQRTDRPLAHAKECPGLGIEAVWDGIVVRLGRRAWVNEISDAPVGAEMPGNSEVCFARAGGGVLRFLLQDELRFDAAQTIAALQDNGMEVEFLSGDTERSVRAMAGNLDVARFRAEMTPAGKVQRIQELQDAGHRVFYVGDGLNDAPALSAATVSMAPSTGSDIGRLSADLVFTGAGLGAVVTAQRVAQRTGMIVRQNFALAVLYNCVAVPVAMMGYVTPMIAALAMSGSSLAVVANSLRLNLMKDDHGFELWRLKEAKPMPPAKQAEMMT